MASPTTIATPRGTLVALPLPQTLVDDPSFSPHPTQEHIDQIICTPIDFSRTDLPVYSPYFAVILDHVFSARESAILRSVPEHHWTSLVQGDAFREVDRALVLNDELASVLYARILPHLENLHVTKLRKPTMAPPTVPSHELHQEHPACRDRPSPDWSEAIAGLNNLKGNQGRHKATWELYAANERLSFLRYGPGMHHDRHCDQVFSRPGMGKEDKSFLTCQVYLNDASSSVDASDDAEDVERGGTTRFWGPPGTEFEDRFVDVVPQVGRVLVFQQRLLWHSGQPVMEGRKYAMRTDLMYKRTFT